MSDPQPHHLPLPKQQPPLLARIRYNLAAGPLRFVNYGAFVAGLIAIVISLVWLFGTNTTRFEKLADTENILPRLLWPEIPDPVKPMVLGEDGNPATLNLIDVRNRMIEIDANARHEERGEPLVDLPPAPAGPALPDLYTSWAEGSACSLTEWQDAARPQVAALIRNGVWQCSGFRRVLAWWPLVIQLGHWKGFLLTMLLGLGLPGVGWVLARRLRHLIEVARLHHKLFGSWVK